ncbi:1-aminocyclopropane-1-carboxylate deaminase [uncultured Campylobacter sp.]|uniref:1-aminocyclopropane-1-carboxylate deaminase n=1 Tax=uncultured Campylobacter sp. TaxID=218934 RepID=UPI002617B25A|nr:1-aminocyclopropane-1-carboxylate deaminase [uncultured Campylobacter sp.]
MDGEFNGNKARKLEYFLHAGLGGIKRVVSYGSSQSNAMYSLSVFAKMNGLEFHYVVSNLNSNLASNPIGNFKFALENGMKIYVDKDRRARARALACELAGLKEGEIYGDEAVNLTDASDRNGLNLKDTGGSNLSNFDERLGFTDINLNAKNMSNLQAEVEPNLQNLGRENLNKFDEQAELESANFSECKSHKNSNFKKSADQTSSNLSAAQDCFIGDSLFINEGVWQPQAEAGFISQARQIERWADAEGKTVDIFLPSGTGTSAAFLAKHVKFDVFTCPCVGDADYLKSEIEALTPNSKVRILPPPKKYHFGDLKLELYQIWREVCEQTGIEFELIYDPVGFLTMTSNLGAFKNEILYIHQGGALGNISQKLRYERKFKETK